MDKICVGIMIVEEKDVVHTTGGNEGKTPGLIRGDHGVELVDLIASVLTRWSRKVGDISGAKGG